MNKEISLKKLWKVFVDFWWKILAVALVAALAAALYTLYFIPKKYSADTTFYIINSNATADYTTASLLSATEQLANDYTGIISSDRFLKPLSDWLKEEHGVEYSTYRLRNMISSSISKSSSLLTISVVNANPEHALLVGEYIADNAPDVIRDLTKRTVFVEERVDNYISALNQLSEKEEFKDYKNTLASMAESLADESRAVECLEVLDAPTKAVVYNPPSLLTNALLAGMGAAVILYAVAAVIRLNSTKIETEEELKELSKYPIIGVIPNWNSK